MTRSTLTTLTIRTTTLCALIAVCTATAAAQQAGFTTRVSAPAARFQTETEKDAWRESQTAPSRALNDIEVASSTQRLIDAVNRDYESRLAVLWNEGNANASDGRLDPGYVSRIDSIRLDQREALRCELSANQQIAYDRNVRGNMTPPITR